MNIGEIQLSWLGHSGFLIKNHKVVYIDPYNLKEEQPKADFILITHSHYDHCSIADIKNLLKPGTKILLTADSQSKMTRFDIPLDIQIVHPNQEMNFGDLKISTVPAYNLDNPAHPKNEEWVGYLVRMNDICIYHAGDSDFIPEMQKLTGYNQPGKKFIALLPVGGRFTMNAEDAAEAAKLIKPFLAIPMHYGSIIGERKDAEEFVTLCKEAGINAQILEKI